MISYNKTLDIKMRTETLETIEVCLQHGDIETAKILGKISEDLKKKIETYDYTKDDARSSRIDASIRKVKQKLCQK